MSSIVKPGGKAFNLRKTTLLVLVVSDLQGVNGGFTAAFGFQSDVVGPTGR
jgi:hypothetical protein